MSSPLTAAELHEAAKLIAGAYRDGSFVTLPDHCRPSDPDEGKVICDLAAGYLGRPVEGWKVGHANEAKRRELGRATPVAGRYFPGMIVGSPATIPANRIRGPYVEGEYVVRFGRDLPPIDGTYGRDEVLAAIDQVIPAIEFAEVRSPAVTDRDVLDLTAFNAGAFRLVLGEPIEGWRDLDLDALDAEIRLDGRTCATAYHGSERTDPFWSTEFFANEMSTRGIAVEANQVLSTGVILPYLPLGGATHIEFTVAGSPTVELTIT
jgi:2-keto-4-pentenoate hydratase